jgi:PAS domain S-box-containing protein
MHRNGGRRNISLSGEITELDGRACILAYATDITARRLAQQALETSLNFNQQLLLASPIGILTYDAGGQCLTANRKAVDQIGGSHEQLLAQNFRTIATWKTSGLLACAEAALVTGEVVRTEARFITSFDKEVWQEAVFTRFVAEGQPNLLLMITDVSERRRQEERTRQLQVENEAMLNNAMVGIAYLRQRRIVSCNRRLEEIFQYGPGDLIGESSELLYDSRETFEHIGVVAYDAVAASRSFRTEVKLRHKDGGVFWGELSGRAIDPANPHEGSIWIYSDISDLKLVEADLRIAAAAFDSQEAIMVTDADSVILKVNKAFTETTGYAAADVVGRTPRLLQSGRHNADFYREMWETLNREGIWQGEIWDRRKTGDEYPKWLTISAVKDEAGTVTHYVGSHFDITERKLAEERIHQLAFFDQLTGLPNRTLLLDRLQAGHGRQRSQRQPRRAAVHRPRQFQGAQRLPWSRCRRPAAEASGPAPGDLRARRRHRGAAGRRRIRRGPGQPGFGPGGGRHRHRTGRGKGSGRAEPDLSLRRRSSSQLGEHRRHPVHGAADSDRRPDEAGRPHDVQGQGGGPQCDPLLRSGDGGRRARSRRAGKRHAAFPGGTVLPASLPGPGDRRRPRHRRRSATALAASRAWHGIARRLHSPRRGNRPDPAPGATGFSKRRAANWPVGRGGPTWRT